MSKVNPATSIVAEDIIKINFGIDRLFGDLIDDFFDIMRKHGITQGSLSEDGKGLICNNFDWTAYQTLFISQLESSLTLGLLLDVPKDISGWPVTDKESSDE